jgi:hypothetical protein
MMQMGNVGASPNIAAMTKAPEATEARGPDHDADSDDKGAAVKSAVAPGVGNAVDKTV